jgi:pyrimidine operon attenuation protein/uracil phosphoribosyltransferase
MTASATSRTLLLQPARVHRTLTRLAYEIVERNRGGETLEIFGIRTRGVALAETIASVIGEVEDLALHVHPLDVTPFRDDLDASADSPRQGSGQAGQAPAPKPLDPRPEVEGRNVVLVDDVLFTGRTARAAIDAVLSYGRPASIQLAVLIDRGHREYPIQPDFVGRTIPTKHRERVLVEVGDEVAVYLEE